jgi:hypothetical protein
VVGNLTAPDDKGVVLNLNGFGPAPVIGIDCEQRGQGGHVFDVGNGSRNEELILKRNPQCRASDTPEPMNCDPRHVQNSFQVLPES